MQVLALHQEKALNMVDLKKIEKILPF